MCEPNTLLLIGTLISAGASAQQGAAADAAGKANAQIQQIMADDARDRGEAAVEQQRIKTAQIKGKQAATFGAGGGEINTGGAVSILADTAQFGELDALTIRANAEREAFAFESGAAISLAEGRNARTTGFLQAGGTLLTGGSELSSRWKLFKKTQIAAGNQNPSFTSFLLGGP